MIRRYYMLFFIVAYGSFGCSSKKTTSIHEPPIMVAWNEDTVNSYQLILNQNMNFFYAVVKKEADNLKHPKTYKGTFKLSGDSILLNFNKDFYADELAEYLIKEASGNYLIQYFKNNNNRMFLRIQRTHTRHF